MRPVTSQVAAEIGYDPAGGTDPGPFTQQVAERLHAADPRWGRRINSTGPISGRHRRLSGRDLPRQPPQHRYRTRRPYHPRPAPVAHLRSLGGDAGSVSHYIPVYPGSFFLFAGRVSDAPTRVGIPGIPELSRVIPGTKLLIARRGGPGKFRAVATHVARAIDDLQMLHWQRA